MKRICVLFAALACLSTNASATPVLLGEIFHDYGSAVGKVDPSGSDALAADYVTVSDASSNRFSDAFDFSALSYQSVSYFELTLDFSETANFLESWRARPGQSTALPALTHVGDSLTTQTFVFGPAVDTFAAAVSAETFNLWFAEEGLGAHDFRLYDATLAVFGTQTSVPEPATFALLGAGLLAVVATRRRKA